MRYKKVKVSECYGTHFHLDDYNLSPPENFMAKYKGDQILCASYPVKTGGGHGDASMIVTKYKFIDTKTMETLEDVKVIYVPLLIKESGNEE